MSMTNRWRAQGKQVFQDDKHFADAIGDVEAMMIVNAMKALDARSTGSPDLSDAVAYGYDTARPGSDRSAEVEYRKGKIVSVRDVPAEDLDTVFRGRDIPTGRRRPILNLNECRAYQASDQMICPCGLQWDINDEEPPQCAHRS